MSLREIVIDQNSELVHMEAQMGNSFLYHQTFLMAAAAESSPEQQKTGEAGSALQSQQMASMVSEAWYRYEELYNKNEIKYAHFWKSY